MASLAKSNNPALEMRRQITAAALRNPIIIDAFLLAALDDGTQKGVNLQALVNARRDIGSGRLDWNKLVTIATSYGFSGDASLIAELLNLYPSSEDGNVGEYVTLLAQASAHAKATDAFRRATSEVARGAAPEAVLSKLAQDIRNVGLEVHSVGVNSKNLKQFSVGRNMLMPHVLLPAPWPRLEVYPGTLTTLVGPAGGGKTSMMTIITEQLLASGYDVVYAMTELNTAQMIARSVCRHAKIPFRDAMNALATTEPRTDKERELQAKLNAHHEYLARLPGTLHYVEVGGYTPEAVVQIASAFRTSKGHPVIVVDYIDMLNIENVKGNLSRGFAEALGVFKQYAQLTGAHVMIAQQMTVGDIRNGAPAWGAGQNSSAFIQRSNAMLVMSFPIAQEDEIVSAPPGSTDPIHVSAGTLHPYGTMTIVKNTWDAAGQAFPVWRGAFDVRPVKWEVVKL